MNKNGTNQSCGEKTTNDKTKQFSKFHLNITPNAPHPAHIQSQHRYEEQREYHPSPMLLEGYHPEPVVEFHENNWIVEAATVLSQNPTAVIAPPTSQAVKQISPLFTLTTTPLIGYSATASILSDTDIFPYFYRVSPDVSNLVGPIIGLFEVCYPSIILTLHSFHEC